LRTRSAAVSATSASTKRVAANRDPVAMSVSPRASQRYQGMILSDLLIKPLSTTSTLRER